MILSEADTRAKLIDPALYARGWTEDLIRREETAGAITIVDGRPRKQARGRVDYTLRVKVNPETQPVAVALIEAKAEHLPPSHGLEQGRAYADTKRLNVPFVFASNGHLFVEFDRGSGVITPARPLAAFPTPAELRARYEAQAGFSLADPVAAPLLARYTGGEGPRRYYQDAAIRAVLEHLARCQKEGTPRRALLSLATGAGKTFIAANLLRRIAEAGQLRRALFVVDRDELRSQAAGALQNLFGSDAARVTATDPARNARVLIATYQTLGIEGDDADATFLTDHYPAGYFSHIIIDECHRSAWGAWSQVLTRNPDAAQIGLTATPRQLDLGRRTPEALADLKVSADNVTYFGQPVYEYDMAQGIEDGYLAACELVRGRVSVDDGGLGADDLMAHRPTDARTGQAMLREELREYYAHVDFEDKLLLPDRVQAMCRDLFTFLLQTGGPEQKTIIFCVRDHHADAVAAAMQNRYAAWCTERGVERADHYAFKCTAAGGSDELKELRGNARDYFVAATVDLLTGPSDSARRSGQSPPGLGQSRQIGASMATPDACGAANRPRQWTGVVAGDGSGDAAVPPALIPADWAEQDAAGWAGTIRKTRTTPAGRLRGRPRPATIAAAPGATGSAACTASSSGAACAACTAAGCGARAMDTERRRRGVKGTDIP